MNINGYTLKAIKTFMGNEGKGFNANLYHNGKKIGEVTDTANGCCEIDVYIDMQMQKQHRDIDTDFLERLYLLHTQERGFKDMLKAKASEALICVKLSKPTPDGDCYVEYFGNKTLTKNAFIDWYEKEGRGGTIESVEIFTSPDDFNIQDVADSEDLSPQEDGMTMM